MKKQHPASSPHRRPLALKRETIVHLAEDRLRQVIGGEIQLPQSTWSQCLGCVTTQSTH